MREFLTELDRFIVMEPFDLHVRVIHRCHLGLQAGELALFHTGIDHLGHELRCLFLFRIVCMLHCDLELSVRVLTDMTFYVFCSRSRGLWVEVQRWRWQYLQHF